MRSRNARVGQWVVIGALCLYGIILGRGILSAAGEMPRATCLSRQSRLIAAVLQYAQDHHDTLPSDTRWQADIQPYGIRTEDFDCPASPRVGTADHAEIGFGWWMSGAALSDWPVPTHIPVLGDSETPILGSSLGMRRHEGGAVLAFLDGHVSWLRQGSPHFYANDFEDATSFSVVGGRTARPMMTWTILSGTNTIGNFHDLLRIPTHEVRASLVADATDNHLLRLTVPAGTTSTYATLPLLEQLQPRPVRHARYQLEIVIPDLSTCMASVTLWHAPLTAVTTMNLNGHTRLSLGPRSYVPRGEQQPFTLAEVTPNRVLRVGYALDLSTTTPPNPPYHLSLLPAAGVTGDKGGPFNLPPEMGSAAVSPNSSQLLGLTLAVHPAFGKRQVERDTAVSFDRVWWYWE